MKTSTISLIAFMTSLYCVSPYACAAQYMANGDETTDLSSRTQGPLGFDDMLANVYDDNPQLKSERDNLRILDERMSTAAGGYRPQVSVDGGIGESRVSENSAPWTYGVDRNAELVVTQPLYNGATDGQWRAAKQRVLEGRARLLASEQKILLAAAAAWLDLYEKENLVDLNDDNQQVTKAYLKATHDRLQAGDGTQTDVAVAESRAAEGETRYAMAVAGRDAARATFQRATGLLPQSTVLPPLPVNLPNDGMEAVELAKKNPEMEQAEYEVAATEDDVDTAIGTRGPTIFIRGSIGDESAAELGLAHLRQDTITINASMPLYAGGVEFSREREAKLAHEKSRFDSYVVSRDVVEEASQSWGRYTAAKEVIRASNHAAEASNRAVANLNEEQKRGTRSLTEVLDAQTQALDTKITALQAETDLRRSAYRLLAAVGRLTAANLNLPVKSYDPTAHYNDVKSRWFGTSIEAQNGADGSNEK